MRHVREIEGAGRRQNLRAAKDSLVRSARTKIEHSLTRGTDLTTNALFLCRKD